MEEVKKSGSDVIVSVGGGSPIDASKAIIYYLQQETGGEYMKQIAIPTTLSAAEYTVKAPPYAACPRSEPVLQISAGFTNEKGHKSGIRSEQLAPAGIILDAELTLHTPEKLWCAPSYPSCSA